MIEGVREIEGVRGGLEIMNLESKSACVLSHRPESA
jgi:hypothetical protein